MPLKAWLGMRPIYRHWSHRIEAHLFVAALAFLLDRAVEKKLRAAGRPLSSPLAGRALETVRCVQIELDRHRKLCVSRGSPHAAQALKGLGIARLDSPQPAAAEETIR